MTADTVIEKVRKLLALATSTNVHEAANAAAAAERLMAEHKLAAADVEARTGEAHDEDIETAEVVEDGRRLISWRDQLVGVLASVNGCQRFSSWKNVEHRAPRCPTTTMLGDRCAFVNGHDGGCSPRAGRGTTRLLLDDVVFVTSVRCFKVVGRASDAQAVAYLFRYLANEINRLCERDGKGAGKAFANSFRHGAVATISARLNEEKKAREAAFRSTAKAGDKRSGVALMVVDRDALAVKDYMKENFPKLHTYRIGGASDAGGYNAGKQAAHEISLPGNNKGLGVAAKQIGGKS